MITIGNVGDRLEKIIFPVAEIQARAKTILAKTGSFKLFSNGQHDSLHGYGLLAAKDSACFSQGLHCRLPDLT